MNKYILPGACTDQDSLVQFIRFIQESVNFYCKAYGTSNMARATKTVWVHYKISAALDGKVLE
jgi:hypothetical protein